MREPLIFKNPFDLKSMILIEPSILVLIEKYRQNNWRATEAGGILMGYRRGDHIQIVSASQPHSEDKRSRFGFFRKAPSHQAIVTDFWKASNQTADYVGEWHTHPEQSPQPSQIDIVEWRKICGRGGGTKMMVFIIGGFDGKLWVGCGRSREILAALPCNASRT